MRRRSWARVRQRCCLFCRSCPPLRCHPLKPPLARAESAPLLLPMLLLPLLLLPLLLLPLLLLPLLLPPSPSFRLLGFPCVVVRRNGDRPQSLPRFNVSTASAVSCCVQAPPDVVAAFRSACISVPLFRVRAAGATDRPALVIPATIPEHDVNSPTSSQQNRRSPSLDVLKGVAARVTSPILSGVSQLVAYVRRSVSPSPRNSPGSNSPMSSIPMVSTSATVLPSSVLMPVPAALPPTAVPSVAGVSGADRVDRVDSRLSAAALLVDQHNAGD